MKKTYLAFIVLLAATIIGCKTKTETQADLSLVWEMGHNQITPGVYENTFYFVNNSDKPLESNWVVYYSQLPGEISPDSLSPITIKPISSTYYTMYPSAQYKPIAAGDTLKVTFRCTNSIIKETNAPEGAYWVRIDKDGKQSAPQNIDLKVIPFTYDYQWSRTGVNEIPYPDGEYMYAQNEKYSGGFSPGKLDIFPSVKKTNLPGGDFSFAQRVAIVADNTLKNEADLLKDKLVTRYNCTVDDKAETVIELAISKEALENEEAYRLDAQNGKIKITANTPHGIFNGTQTLLQLIGANKLPYTLPNMQLADYPDLMYRGQMIDVARNFTKKEDILKLIDLFASYKLNVLHFHITDDEGWRVEINGLEELTQIASRRGHTLDESECLYPAYGSGWDANNSQSRGNGYYTRADFMEILRYAQQRHVQVIPEMDFPGHARAAIKAMNVRYNKYKDTDKQKAEEYLLTDFDDVSVYVSAQHYTDNVINVAMPSTYRFVDKVVTEIQAMYKEAGVDFAVLHLGGDEVPKGAWEKSPLCQAFMKEKNMVEIRQLKDYFIQQTLEIFKKRNIQMAAWQEVALLPDETPNKLFANDNIISYCWNTVPEWKGDQIPYHLANSGYPVILSNVSNLYFDLSYNKHQKEPGLYWGGFVNEYSSFNMLPFDIYRSVRNDLKGNPVDMATASKNKEPLAQNARKNIKGMQGQLFAETIRNFGMIEYSLFPKLFGLAERAWNAEPQWAKSTDEKDYLEAVRFYNNKIAEKELPRLQWLQVNFRVAQPGIKVVDNKVYMNSTLPQAEIRYTTDGSEPTASSALWTQPIDYPQGDIKAKAFYCGKESVATLLRKQ